MVASFDICLFRVAGLGRDGLKAKAVVYEVADRSLGRLSLDRLESGCCEDNRILSPFEQRRIEGDSRKVIGADSGAAPHRG